MALSPVVVSLAALEKGDIPFSTLISAFGPDSLGIIIVKDVPAEFKELRSRLLSYSSYLGNLPEQQLEKLENPSAKYLTGWSLGKETLKNGKPDTLKGSYYANCAFYVDPSLSAAVPTEEFSLDNFPEYLSPNLWPAKELLPGFQATFESLCKVIIDTAVLVAQAIDRYGEKEIDGYTPGYLDHVVRTSTTTKARLLHYFPAPEIEKGPEAENNEDWCAIHKDHGCLTGLTSAMFIDEINTPPNLSVTVGGEKSLPVLSELPSSPDPDAGLFIQTRTGKTVQVKIPRDCIAFQTGEALERITQGSLKAVPHYVKGVRPRIGGGSIARNTLAVFTQPNLGELVDPKMNINFGEFARGVVDKNTVAS